MDGERPTDGVQERGKTKGMGGKICFARERTGEGGEGMEEAWEGVVEECAPHSGTMGGATRPAEMGAQSWVIQRRERWSSLAFRGDVRSTPLSAQDSSRKERKTL